MTRNNLIFLGACSIMSSHLTNFQINPEENLKNSIDWATKIYDRVHDEGTIATWEVQCYFNDAKRWARSGNKFINQTFDNYKGAYEAMKKYGSAGKEYRVVKL